MSETARDILKAKLAAKIAGFKIQREPKPFTGDAEAVAGAEAPVQLQRNDLNPCKSIVQGPVNPSKVPQRVPKTVKAIAKSTIAPKKPAPIPQPETPNPSLFPSLQESISFGNFSFGEEVDTRSRIKHGAKRARLEREIRQVKQQNAALKRAESLGGVEAKIAMVRDNEINKAIQRAAGARVHDDVSKLKKSQRLSKTKKLKSAAKWADRLSAAKEDKAARVAKREQNIQKFKMKKKPTLEAEKVSAEPEKAVDGKKTRKERKADKDKMEKIRAKYGKGDKNDDGGRRPTFDKKGRKPGLDRNGGKPSFDRKGGKPSFDRKGGKPSFDRKGGKPSSDRSKVKKFSRK